MMKEEFEQLTGVLVSLKYYESVIEPAYVEDNQDKTTWCAAWKKENKADIKNCLGYAVEGMIFDLLSANAKIKTLDEKFNKCAELLQAERTANEALRKETAELYELNQAHKNNEEEIAKLHAEIASMRDADAKCKAQGGEILMLKAKLYDLLIA